MSEHALEHRLEQRIEALGYELVELERAGSRARPVLRVRIDRSASEPGSGVTVEDCTRVSRALEAILDEDEKIAERYVLEVSSPGLERPLVRASDFTRFAGREIALRGHVPLAGVGRRVEGQLIGLVEEGGRERIRVRTTEGREVDIPREDVARAHLLFRWKSGA